LEGQECFLWDFLCEEYGPTTDLDKDMGEATSSDFKGTVWGEGNELVRYFNNLG
jgi:hypothetical protein